MAINLRTGIVIVLRAIAIFDCTYRDRTFQSILNSIKHKYLIEIRYTIVDTIFLLYFLNSNGFFIVGKHWQRDCGLKTGKKRVLG